MTHQSIIIIGSGVFGLTTALALNRRGYENITVCNPGPVPHPLAASTDISKVIRMEYGADDQYMAMGDAAIQGWHEWNSHFERELYHETGVLMLRRSPMAPGDFEYESFAALKAAGQSPEHLSVNQIQQRYPAWSSAYVDGFYHGRGGFAESGMVITALATEASRHDIRFFNEQAVIIEDNRVIFNGGDHLSADLIVVCAGAWTPILIPELATHLQAVGQPVFHLQPDEPTLFKAEQFPVFTADISRTGWYGFPLLNGVVKIGNHGTGQILDPEYDERAMRPEDEYRLRQMLAETFPTLQDAPIVYRRVCLYCDTRDEHFWIDYYPNNRHIFVATGGSGHAFKFAPIMGDLIVDAMEGKPNAWLERFKWREAGYTGEEAARFRGNSL